MCPVRCDGPETRAHVCVCVCVCLCVCSGRQARRRMALQTTSQQNRCTRLLRRDQGTCVCVCVMRGFTEHTDRGDAPVSGSNVRVSVCVYEGHPCAVFVPRPKVCLTGGRLRSTKGRVLTCVCLCVCVSQDPVDLSLINQRLKSGQYYLTLDIFIADLRRMLNNCRSGCTTLLSYHRYIASLPAYTRAAVPSARVHMCLLLAFVCVALQDLQRCGYDILQDRSQA